jgi:hypothetical protein
MAYENWFTYANSDKTEYGICIVFHGVHIAQTFCFSVTQINCDDSVLFEKVGM